MLRDMLHRNIGAPLASLQFYGIFFCLFYLLMTSPARAVAPPENSFDILRLSCLMNRRNFSMWTPASWLIIFCLPFSSFSSCSSSQCVTIFYTSQSSWQPCLSYSKTVAQEISGLLRQVAQYQISSRLAICNRRKPGICLTEEQAIKLLYLPSQGQLLQTRPIPILYNRTHHHLKAAKLNLPSDWGMRIFLRRYPTDLPISLRAALLYHIVGCY